MQLLGKGNQHDWTGSNRIFRGPGLVREEPDSIPSPRKFQVVTAMAEQSGECAADLFQRDWTRLLPNLRLAG